MNFSFKILNNNSKTSTGMYDIFFFALQLTGCFHVRYLTGSWPQPCSVHFTDGEIKAQQNRLK